MSIKRSALSIFDSVRDMGNVEEDDEFGEDMGGEIKILEKIVKKIATLAELSNQKNPFDEGKLKDMKNEELGYITQIAGADALKSKSRVANGQEFEDDSAKFGV